MIVYPAIDIRGGRAVRLVEGDYDRETVFDADPVDAALRWSAWRRRHQQRARRAHWHRRMRSMPRSRKLRL